MKTGRMAPVERQLTNGALTSSNGLCAHTTMSVHFHSKKNVTWTTIRFTTLNMESEMEEIAQWMGINKRE